jgi:hypothetical protein
VPVVLRERVWRDRLILKLHRSFLAASPLRPEERGYAAPFPILKIVFVQPAGMPVCGQTGLRGFPAPPASAEVCLAALLPLESVLEQAGVRRSALVWRPANDGTTSWVRFISPGATAPW